MGQLKHFLFRKGWQSLLAALIGFTLFPGSVHAEQANKLLMVHSDNCPWCEAFDEEVGPSYDKTPEGQRYPLERIDFYEEFPEQYRIKFPASFTPTFIILHENAEIGRIEGYPGSDLFWWRLSEFILPAQ